MGAEEDRENHIIDVHEEEKKRRLEVTDETYGTKTLPTLEKLDYKIDTKFHATEWTPGMIGSEELFHCKVRFEGSSTLEGIRNLAEAGYIDQPLKASLRNVHRLGKSVIKLQPKSRTNRSAN